MLALQPYQYWRSDVRKRRYRLSMLALQQAAGQTNVIHSASYRLSMLALQPGYRHWLVEARRILLPLEHVGVATFEYAMKKGSCKPFSVTA